jgi:Tfp pilus assembly protein PilX
VKKYSPQKHRVRAGIVSTLTSAPSGPPRFATLNAKDPGIKTTNSARDKIFGDGGMILLTVLMLLSLLMVVGMGAGVSVRNDFRMTANSRSSITALHLADAGIEWGKQQIASAATMPPAVPNGISALPTGSYSVSFVSSTQTGLLSARVVLRSVGSASNASQTVQAQITKYYDLADGAMVLRGNARSINFAGSLFSISGIDHDLITGAPLSGFRPRAGITIESIAGLSQLESALDEAQKRNIVGDDGNGAAIAASSRISGNEIARIASDLCAAPHATVSTVPSAGNLTIVNNTWGSRIAPQLRCVNGLPGSGDSVTFGANTGGTGIMVIRDAEVVLTGEFRWEGLILISGGDVGFRVESAADKEILGALIIHESGNGIGSGPALLDIQGPLHVRFSRPALNLVAPLVPVATLAPSYAALPFALKQDYWRSISP